MPLAPSSSTAYVDVTRKKQAVAVQAQHFTHFDGKGQAHMVDVGAKDVTHRVARAAGRIAMQPETLARIRAGTVAKGDVLLVARVAAIAASKRTADLIRCATRCRSRASPVEFSFDEEQPPWASR
jgi:cyclic pyranopterin phosphate synthase